MGTLLVTAPRASAAALASLNLVMTAVALLSLQAGLPAAIHAAAPESGGYTQYTLQNQPKRF